MQITANPLKQVNDVNDQPTDILFSSNVVTENSLNGTIIGNFTTTDQDSGQTHTFLITNNVGRLSFFYTTSCVNCFLYVLCYRSILLYKTLHDTVLCIHLSFHTESRDTHEGL